MGKKSFRKKIGRFAKKAHKVVKKTAKVVDKVAKIAGPILVEVGELTGQPELVALGEGAETLAKVLDVGIAIDKKLTTAFKNKDVNAVADIAGDLVGDLGLATPAQIEKGKSLAKSAGSITKKALGGDTKGALVEGAKVLGKEALERELITPKQLGVGKKILKKAKPLLSAGAKMIAPKQEENIEDVRAKLLEILMDINDGSVDNKAFTPQQAPPPPVAVR